MKKIMNESHLGYGFLRCPINENGIDKTIWIEAIDEYMKGNFCYYDVHPNYLDGKSEIYLRSLVVERYPRESFLVADKMPYYGIKGYDDYEKVFQNSMNNCGVSFFDYYLLHALTIEHYELHMKYGGFDFLKEKKASGQIKHIGFSFHGDPDLLETILTEHPETEFVQLQINLIDWENPAIQSKTLYDIARKHNIPIMVMSPTKGGGIVNSYVKEATGKTDRELANIAFSFVASLPGVFVILSGMTDKQQVIDNRSSIEKDYLFNSKIDFSDEYGKLVKRIVEINKIPCTSCRYCARVCSKGIAIPEILSLLNSVAGGGDKDKTVLGRHRTMYRGTIKDNGKAGKCLHCKACEKVCPQKIGISDYMSEAERVFESGTKMKSIDRFIFPYEIVNKGSRIVLYGAGVVGRAYYAQVNKTHHVEIEKWIDRDYENHRKEGLEVGGIEFEYNKVKFDYIVIAIENEKIAMEIKEFLLNKGINEKKIVWVPPKN